MWVLIDVSYLAHVALHSTHGLSVEEMPTGVLYGFFGQLKTICTTQAIQSNKIALFFDSRRSHRRKVYPDYKRKRKENRTEEDVLRLTAMHDQLKILRRDILPAMGIPTYRQVGLESDDLIAQAALMLQLKDEQGVMITADGDLFQCITAYCHWYDPVRGLYYNRKSFKQKKGIDAKMWGEVKCLAGCSGDNVAGVPGVGEKTAIQFLNNELPSSYKRYQAIVSEDGRAIRKRNKKLVVLPHVKTKSFKLKRPEFNHDAFFYYCERYRLQSFLDKRNEWISLFGTKLRKRKKRGLLK